MKFPPLLGTFFGRGGQGLLVEFGRLSSSQSAARRNEGGRVAVARFHGSDSLSCLLTSGWQRFIGMAGALQGNPERSLSDSQPISTACAGSVQNFPALPLTAGLESNGREMKSRLEFRPVAYDRKCTCPWVRLDRRSGEVRLPADDS